MSIETVKFRGRHAAKGAVAAIVCGGLSVVILIVLCLIGAFADQTPQLAGVIAVSATLTSAVGLAWSVVSYYERDIYTGVPIAGMIVNGLALILYALVFILGNA